VGTRSDFTRRKKSVAAGRSVRVSVPLVEVAREEPSALRSSREMPSAGERLVTTRLPVMGVARRKR
jgi:hypothetical protein